MIQLLKGNFTYIGINYLTSKKARNRLIGASTKIKKQVVFIIITANLVFLISFLIYTALTFLFNQLSIGMWIFSIGIIIRVILENKAKTILQVRF